VESDRSRNRLWRNISRGEENAVDKEGQRSELKDAMPCQMRERVREGHQG